MARTWVKKIARLAEQGFIVAQYLLGRIFQKGVGARRDDLLAYKWFCVAEEMCRQLRLRSRRQKQLLQSVLSSDEISRAEYAGLDQFCKFQQETNPRLWGEGVLPAAEPAGNLSPGMRPAREPK